ncbi:TlpA family protein disulfide reductase [Solibacillus isronensis]|uniref:TlpA family protein disulfide reductase n=1 Tax=Solibacillus isronensis TaxID=412383 RepID=UPI0039A17740
MYDNENKEVTMAQSTILLFTSTHCDICKSVYPILEIVKQKYSNINIIIMMLATDEEAKNTIIRFNIKRSIPVSLIKDEDLFALGIPGFPFCYLLDPNGNIIEKGIVNKIEHFDILLSNHVNIENVS